MKQIWKLGGQHSVLLYKGPGKNYETKCMVQPGHEAIVTEMSGQWCKDSTTGAWFHPKTDTNEVLWKFTEDLERSTVPATTQSPTIPDYEPDEPITSAYMPDLGAYKVSMTDEELTESLNGSLKIKNLRGIHGIPYQFLSSVDTRLDSEFDSLGIMYAEKIVSQMPLLLMTPGVPVFLSQYGKKERDKFLSAIVGGNRSELDEVLQWEGKYYSLKFDYVQYYKYVNPACRAGARFLGLQDERLDGIPLDKYGWDQNVAENINSGGGISFETVKNLQKILPYRGCVPFYIDSDTQISDNFSNTTAESPLSSQINSMSDMGRELSFILGRTDTALGTNFDKFVSQEDLRSNMQNVTDFVSKFTRGNGGHNIFTSLANSIQTVAAGGRLIFPEIWSDSSFSRSFNVKLKLVSPDADKLSWYLNIFVPLMHLVAFVLPRQVDANGYISPFCLKAFYKGFFNIDMGIITDMSFDKGAEGCWTREGLPTVVDVSFTIKDLYSIMAMSSNENIKYNLMNNIMELDYIANLCGININEPDVGRMIDMWFTQNISTKLSDTFRLNFGRGIEQAVNNKLLKIFLGGRV